MKRFIRICVVLLMIIAFVSHAYAARPKRLTKTITWEIKDDCLIISGKGDMPDYDFDFSNECYRDEVPPWNKYPIEITSVIIEDGITSIGDHAFWGYYHILGIKNLTIPNSVMSIGDYAFAGNNITTLNIPISVTSIGDFAFESNYITTLTIPDSVTSIGVHAFRYNKITDLSISNSVTSIGDYAFADNDITTLIIPDSVTSIGRGAFRYNEITDLSISNSVTSIGDYAFADNDITIANIPNSVMSIGIAAFADNDITTANIPNSVTSVGDYAFHRNDITSLTIPNSVISIGDYAFESNNITTLTIPDSVTSIGMGAFRYNDVTSLSIPNSVTSIEDYVFAHNKIETLTIPDSVTSVGVYAFVGNNIKSLNISDSVKSIGDNAFAPKFKEVFSARIIHLPSWVTDKECERIGICLDSYYEYHTPTVEWLLKNAKELRSNQKYNAALKYILRAINNEATTDPTEDCYNEAGLCYYYLGKYSDAINMFRMAYDLHPTNDYVKGVFACNIGDSYRLMNDKKEAYKWYTIAFDLGENRAWERVSEYYDVVASVDKIWTANTKDNTVFHLNNLRIHNALKEEVTLILYVYDEKKQQLTDKNNQYYSPDGYVQFKSEIESVTYLKSIWEDYKITVPTSEIHIDRTKKSPIPYCKLIVKDKDGKIVYTSPYFKFTLDKIETAAPTPASTVAETSSINKTTQANSLRQGDNTKTNVTTNTSGVGGYVPVQQQTYTPRPVEQKYYETIYVDVDCPHCHRSGRCQSCNGSGTIQYMFGEGVVDCPNCRNGRCQYCNGSGTVKDRQTVERTRIVYR